MQPLRMVDESSDSQYQPETYLDDQSETECKQFGNFSPTYLDFGSTMPLPPPKNPVGANEHTSTFSVPIALKVDIEDFEAEVNVQNEKKILQEKDFH